MTSVRTVQAFVDAALPVHITLKDGRWASVLLVDIVDACAVSKHGLMFPIFDIASIELADGLSDGRRQWR